MSKLSDLLSQLKHSETPGNVTPGLKNAVFRGQHKDRQNRRLITLASILVMIVALGGIAAFLLPKYLASDSLTARVDYAARRPIDPENSERLRSAPIPLAGEKAALDIAVPPEGKDKSSSEISIGTEEKKIVKAGPGEKNVKMPGNAVIPTEEVTSSVRVREEASERSEVTGKLPVGEAAEYIRSEPDWHYVRLNNGTEGYVHQAWTRLVSDATPPPMDQASTLAAAHSPQKTELRPAVKTEFQKEKPAMPHLIQTAGTKNIEKDSLSGNIVREGTIKGNSGPAKTSDLYKASYYEKQNDYKNAISFYREVLDRDPGNFVVANKVAHLLMKLELKEDALEYIDKALAQNEAYVPALINAGIIHAQTAKYRKAEEYLSKALSREGQNMAALFNMSLLYEVEGNYDKAFDYYSKLQRLGDIRGTEGLKRVGGRKQ